MQVSRARQMYPRGQIDSVNIFFVLNLGIDLAKGY